MKQIIIKKFFIVNILIFTFVISSCGTDSKKDAEVTLNVSALSVNEISKKLIFNPKSTQNYLVAINDLESLENKNNRIKFFLGMAHMYQGEVYKIAATLMREIQQDLYTKSSNPDPAHGEKFPIVDEKDFGEIRDKLLLLLAVDAFFLGQSQKSKLIASRINKSADFSHLITKLNSKTSVEHSGTYLGWLDYKNEFPNPDAFPDELINYLKAETIYKSAGPKKALDYMDEHKIILSNYFDDPKVSYYNASAYDLAGLIHFQLAQEQLGSALKDDSSNVDTFQRILNIIYYVNNGSKIGIQAPIISVLNSEIEYLLKHAKEFNQLVNQGKHAYELDYIYFKNNVLKMDKVPIGIESLFSQIKQSDMSQAYEKYLFTNGQFIGSPLYLNLKKIENDLIKMKQYPTLMSGIVESINLTTGAKEDKALVQKFSDGLSFNIAITDNSWHRNRVGYVISLLGSLRWHGGRIPNCMEFIIQESNKNPRLKSLKNVVKLFLGGFHGLQSD